MVRIRRWKGGKKIQKSEVPQRPTVLKAQKRKIRRGTAKQLSQAKLKPSPIASSLLTFHVTDLICPLHVKYKR